MVTSIHMTKLSMLVRMVARSLEQALHTIALPANFKGFDGATEWFKYDGEVVDTARLLTKFNV